MRLVGRKLLEDFAALHADIRGPLNAWVAEAQEANWRVPADLKARFPNASFLADNRVVFNLKGNNYRVEVKLSYDINVVLVLRIGTHSEYSKWK
jgi:mRNA interferase HigB